MTEGLPSKEHLADELHRALTTLSADAQQAALRKSTELGFDPNKGRVALEEAFINLTQARDLLLEAVSERKLVQLPLSIQYKLFEHVGAVGRELSALVNGTDAVVNLIDAIEQLNADVWQFNLHNLSGQVLGFQTKMNELKAQETTIRQAARSAGELQGLRAQADTLLETIGAWAKSAEEQQVVATKSLEHIQITFREATEVAQRVSSVGAQVDQHETTAAQQLANAKLAAADTDAIASKSKEMRTEIEAARDSLQELNVAAQQLLKSTEKASADQIAGLETRFASLFESTKGQTETLQSQHVESVAALVAKSSANIDGLVSSAEARVATLVQETTDGASKAAALRDTAFEGRVDTFSRQSEETVRAFAEKSEETLRVADAEYKRLVAHLDELEGRISEP